MGKETIGEREQTLSDNLSGNLSGKRSGTSPVYALIIAQHFAFVKGFFETF